MRQVVLDTETTGLETSQGHRIIEIGAVEVVNRRLTGRHFHQYINPERDIDEGAQAVHGITADFLADKPKFVDIADDFVQFIEDSELVIHNAAFDVGFLNFELKLLKPARPMIEDLCTVLDSLLLARRKHPGQKNSLDALCRRYGIDNSDRTLHGALLDAEILADVYLAMTGGQTLMFMGEQEANDKQQSDQTAALELNVSNLKLRVLQASPSELAAHEAQLDALDQAGEQGSLWRRLSTAGESQP